MAAISAGMQFRSHTPRCLYRPLAKNALPLSKFVVGKTLVQSITLEREVD
jgi:hypothetical protein